MIESSPDTSLLAAFGVTIKTVVGGAFGGFISLRFNEDLHTWEKWMTFLGGWGLGAWLAPPINTYLEITQRPAWEVGTALLIGLFGMSFAAAVIKAIKGLDLVGLISAAITRCTGGSK